MSEPQLIMYMTFCTLRVEPQFVMDRTFCTLSETSVHGGVEVLHLGETVMGGALCMHLSELSS